MTTKRLMGRLALAIASLSFLVAAMEAVVPDAPGSAQAAAIAQSVDSARAVVLAVDAAQSKVNFTLGTTLHTVHGTFALKRGTLRVEPDGKASGEIVADSASGQSGDSGRDKKMHKDVLESAKYTEVVFRPDRVDGKFSATGTVSVRMHGKFA